MAREVPEAGAARLALVRRIGAPGGELAISDRLTGDRSNGERDADPRERGHSPAVNCDERERAREDRDESRLGLEEDEERAVDVRCPAAAELLVAAVLRFAERRVADAGAADAVGPGDIDVARVPDPARDQSEQRHHRCGRSSGDRDQQPRRGDHLAMQFAARAVEVWPAIRGGG